MPGTSPGMTTVSFSVSEPWHAACSFEAAGDLSARPREYQRRQAIIFRLSGVVRSEVS
jgi:hypothetical protein